MEWASPEEKEHCLAPFTQRDVLSIFTHVSDEHQALLGMNEFCKIKDLIMLTILVPPPVARPAIMASEGSRSRGQDDLTHKLQDINKRSIELTQHIQSTANIDDDQSHCTWRNVVITAELYERIGRLQFEVFTYMNNNIRGQKQSTQRSGAPTKSITDRLRGKDGRIRGNLMGKRVDFSARSVITPDAGV
jgi:DNA-directed RNA polymerase II subunit RPB1